MRLSLRRAAAIAACAIALAGAASAVSAPASAAPEPSSSGAGGAAVPAATVTLITGDVVSLAPAGNGKVAASVRPGAGREGVTFHTLEVDGGLRVLPSDVVPYLETHRLDASLFDVEKLVRDGYADGAASSLPLIVQYAGGAQPAPGARLLSGDARALPSIGGAAIRPEKASLTQFWKQQRQQPAAGAQRAMAGGIDRIWLDAKVHPVLDRSTAQIGAPAAWQAGLDGKGVKVAVLDTGVDSGHPDLAGRVSQLQNFSGSPDTADRFGHGTHVASIVAGSGAASGGSRKGVAPGADLLVGKVLGDDGSGYDSWIIAGMEWAAAQGARVVNLSLGGDPTDGTDPMSAAVDRISAQTGALFVIAAGNEGGDHTVGTPGAANSALTVGAVDRADALADFSSRGPRLGDEGVKPEITAPGVGIVAARAAGTTMGDPVDDRYTAASGTSMATPHVAGAAAILAQEHPDWTGAQLKDGLVSTAHRGSGTVYEQGAGRVDVARAVTQPVSATGAVSFGVHDSSERGVLSRDLTFTNAGAAAATLSLAMSDAAFSFPAGTVTVPAHGTATVPLRLDLARLTPGRFSGWVTATGSGVSTTTAVGVTLDRPYHRVTVRAVDRAGNPVAVPVFTLFGDDRRFDTLSWLPTGGAVYEVEEGTYLLHAVLEDGGPADDQATLLVIPELAVRADLTVLLDARKGTPVRIETPQPSEQRTVLSYYVHRVTGSGREIDHGVMHFSNVGQVNVTPTAKVAKGVFEFSSRWQLVAPLVRASADGLAGQLPLRLLGRSPTFPGPRRFPLVTGGDVRGKAVVVPPSPDVSEEDQIAAAAAKGAAVVIVIRPPDQSTWTNWTPQGEREPAVALVAPSDLGQRLLARAATGRATLQLTLTPSSPYLYDVFQVSRGQVPAKITYRVTEANSMRIASRYADNGGFGWTAEQRFGWQPWQEYAWNDTSRTVAAPSQREEWVSAGDAVWQHLVAADLPWSDWGPLESGVGGPPVSYRPGHATETWYGPVVRPAPLDGTSRTGDVLALRIPEYVDADGHYSVGEADRATVTLTRDGAPLATPRDGWQDVTVPPGPAAYRLTMTTQRGGPEWEWGTRTETVWDFRSGHTSTPAALPLLRVDYGVPVDLSGKAGGRPHLISLCVPGSTALTAAVSSDEGATWTPAFTFGAGTRGCSVAIIPGGTGSVSLRVHATDRAGNAVTQTVIRAYGR
ncbi:S8 family serine peptidase [Dactylosporangium sp. CA-092794]|uniref:S8 family serine peptidase n=1 Tax=Dactylosporangium sp. CA-092794 TaxID=3239929 RepID=UPI003D8B933F